MTLKRTQGKSELIDRFLFSLVPEGYKTGQVANVNLIPTGLKEGKHLSRKMKRLSNLKAGIKVVDYPEQKAVKVTIVPAAIAGWCLELCLLKEDLIKSLMISDSTNGQKLIIVSSPKADSEISFRGREYKLLLKVSDISVLADYALKYYRDGVAEVDHLDLEANSNSGLKYGCYVTFYAAEFNPPVTEEEARRRLGI